MPEWLHRKSSVVHRRQSQVSRMESAMTIDSTVDGPRQPDLSHTMSAKSIGSGYGSGFGNGFGSGFGSRFGRGAPTSNARPPFLPFSRADGGRAVRADAPVSSIVPAGGS